MTADLDRTRAERGNYEPLYSSFNPNNTFIPPPSVYDAMLLQKENKTKKTSISGTTLSKSRGGARTSSALHGEASLMASGNANISLFHRVGSIEGSPVKMRSKNFKGTAEKGIRSSAFKLL